jgi:hypothetical protein
MNKLQIQITQIDNGYVVGHPDIKKIVSASAVEQQMMAQQGMPSIAHHERSLSLACDYIKETFCQDGD